LPSISPPCSSARETCFELILCALVDSGLSPDRLELELSNAALLEKDQPAHLLVIRQLKNLGVSIVLDNCGPDIPRELSDRLSGSTRSMTTNRWRRVSQPPGLGRGRRSVLALAHGLDIATAAKGIENVAQYEALLAAVSILHRLSVRPAGSAFRTRLDA